MLVSGDEISAAGPRQKIKHRGFRAIFGRRVKISSTVEWWGPDGAGVPINDAEHSHRPFSVTRTFCLGPTDLIKRADLQATMDSLAKTDEGGWVYRTTDTGRMQREAEYATNEAEATFPCGCG